MASTTVASRPRRRRLSTPTLLGLSLSAFIVAVFLLYKGLMPNLQDNIARAVPELVDAQRRSTSA